MSDNTEKIRTRRLSSILKNVGANGDSPTQTFSRRSKRISFSRVNNVKEFAADQENRTIWGESYEKRASVPSAVSTSSELCNTNVTSASEQLFVNNNSARTLQIDLFAGIEDEYMEMSSEQSPTKILNQSMFIDETMNCDEGAAASVTISNSSHMSIVSYTNKRKTNETMSMDEAVVELTKSVKVRKMNEENMEITFAPELQGQHTVLQHITMDSTDDLCEHPLTKRDVNLNTTRLNEIDVSDIDDLSNYQIISRQSDVKSTDSETVTTDISNKTTTCSADMAVDDRSILSTSSDVFLPNVNKTHYYGCGNVSSGIDQTVSVQNPLQENNFTKQQTSDQNDEPDENKFNPNVNHTQLYGRDIVSDVSDRFDDPDENDEPDKNKFHPNVNKTQFYCRDDISDGIDQTHVVQNPLQENNFTDQRIFNEKGDPGENISNMRGLDESDDLPVFASKFGDAQRYMVEDLSIFMDIKYKTEINVPTSHSIFGNTDEHGIEDLTISMDMNFKSEVVNDNDMPSESIIDSNNKHSELPETSQSSQSQINTPEKDSCSLVPDKSGSHFLPITDFSFGNSEPFSSTRVAPINNLTLNSTNNDVMKANSSIVTFNECPTLTRQIRDLRSGMSSQNNTDELCNLEPDQLRKRSEMKKAFLDISNAMPRDMLSETKFDLIDDTIDEVFATNDSLREKFATNESLMKGEANVLLKEEPVRKDSMEKTKEILRDELASGESNTVPAIKKEVQNASRCLRCTNCRKSLDTNNLSMLKVEDLHEIQLDFSDLNQFKGYASFKDVIEAHKKRTAAKELEEQTLIDQNVEAPDIRFLWENYLKSTVEPLSVHSPEPLVCLPMRMSVQYLMKNKMRTEYTNWKYFDNYFNIGAIALRHEKIPSIRIHIKFDTKGPAKAAELNMPLLFKRVFVEECPVYLKNISPRNYLKHKHGMALLPLNLTTIISDSDNIYKGLDEINVWFENTVIKINEMELLTAEHEAFLKMEENVCYIEQTLFDPRKYLMQEFFITLDKIDAVGPRNVILKPPCETTTEFKNLPIGLPFLRAFLGNPKSFLSPFLEG